MAAEPYMNGKGGGVKEGRPHRAESWNGVKFFNGRSVFSMDNLTQLASHITADQLRENMEVWRPEETIAASVPFFNEGKVMVKGPPQSGKGTVLFGLSEMCDILGVGYMFFNGHHQEVSGAELAAQIRRADEAGYPIFFDSYDYLFLGSRSRGRRMSAQDQIIRDQEIIDALNQVRVPVAITFHDKEHTDAFMSGELIEHFEPFHRKFPVYQIPLYLQSDASALKFLEDHDIPPSVADFLMGLDQNETFITVAEREQSVSLDSTQLISALKTYPVLKELVRGEKQRLFAIMDTILKGPGEPEHEQALLDLAVLLEQTEIKRLNLTQERRRKKSHNKNSR